MAILEIQENILICLHGKENTEKIASISQEKKYDNQISSLHTEQNAH